MLFILHIGYQNDMPVCPVRLMSTDHQWIFISLQLLWCLICLIIRVIITNFTLLEYKYRAV